MQEIIIKNIKFNQKYMIDEQGNIWSPYNGGKYLTPSLTKKGYLRIVLQTSEGKKTFQVHRLVLETFSPIDNCDKFEVNHIDGNKSNNCLDNLEWCSGSFNIRHSLDTGLKTPAKGTQIASHKLTEQEVLEICELLINSDLSLAQIGERYNVSKHCVFDIKRKKSWAWLTEKYTFK